MKTGCLGEENSSKPSWPRTRHRGRRRLRSLGEGGVVGVFVRPNIKNSAGVVLFFSLTAFKLKLKLNLNKFLLRVDRETFLRVIRGQHLGKNRSELCYFYFVEVVFVYIYIYGVV